MGCAARKKEKGLIEGKGILVVVGARDDMGRLKRGGEKEENSFIRKGEDVEAEQSGAKVRTEE